MRLVTALLILAAAAPGQEGWRPLGRAEGLPSDDVYAICSGGPERVWAATGAGLCLIEAYDVRRIGPDGVPRLVAPAPGDGVYAVYPQGIAWVREGLQDWIELPFDPARAAATAIAAEDDGTLTVWTAEQAFVRPPGGAWRASGATAPADRSIVHRGEVWRPSRGRGILRQRLRPRFRRFEILGASRVHALAAGPGGAVWCGTENGLAKVVGDRVTTIPAIDGKELGNVTACAVDREGRVWIGSGSAFQGVYRLDGDRWTHENEIGAYVHRITTDRTGALWFATLGADRGAGAGAWFFADGAFQRAPAVGDTASDRVYDVAARDPGGVLWFATLHGLAAFEGEGRITHYTPEKDGLRGEKVWCLCAARDGALWIGYQTVPGASRLARGEITHYDVEDGLCDGNVWSIVEGDPGVFWFATRNGLSRYDGRRWSTFREEEGLGPWPLWPLLPGADGTLWIGTIGAGLYRLDPGDDLPPRTRFAEPVFTGRTGDPVTVRWSGCDAWYDTPRVDLWYRWRLDGGRWSAASPATAVLVEPGPGVHRLEVQALDRFGNAEDPPPGVEIRVEGPPRYPWAAIAAFALALLVVGFVIGRRDRAAGS